MIELKSLLLVTFGQIGLFPLDSKENASIVSDKPSLKILCQAALIRFGSPTKPPLDCYLLI